MTDVQDISYTGGNVNIANSTTSTSTTTGALQVAGGAGIVENLHVGGELHVGTHEITPNAEDITKQLSFSGANNQVGVANVTDLVVTTGVTRSFKVLMSVVVIATANLYSQVTLEAVQKASGWYFVTSYVGDDTLVTFSITSGGQVQYTSGNYTGFTSLTMQFKLDSIGI